VRHQSLFRQVARRMPQTLPSISADSRLQLPHQQRRVASSVTPPVSAPVQTVAKIDPPTFATRMQETFANGFSKLILAGCGWQLGAESGDDAGCKDHGLHFMFWTGFGDGLGVGFGHVAYKLAYYAVVSAANYTLDAKFALPDIRREAVVGLHLGSASFCSGTAWQPIVDFLKWQEFGYYSASALTGFLCGSMFLIGMRLGRHLYPKLLGDQVIAKPDTKNLIGDASLSLAGIAGASAMFVATDTSFEDNPFKKIFGIEVPHAHTTNIITAGAATVTGFVGAQMVQNLCLSAVDRIKNSPPTDPTPTVRSMQLRK